jgi:hypothetical protein
MRSLALQLRDIRTNDVTFLTAPSQPDAIDTTPDGQSIVRLDKRECAALWEALRKDDMDSYLAEYGGDVLPRERQVN